MNKDEAIHKALKVLNCLNNDRVYETAWVKGAITACEEALEQPAQEPVAWRSEGGVLTEARLQAESWVSHGGKATPLYTHPAQPLSDDEITNLEADSHVKTSHDTWEFDVYGFARAIEQALKEKNG